MSLLQVSFGKILTPLGVVLLSYGFASYFNLLPSTPLSAIIVVTGFPLTLLGFALSYAQLEPVPCRSTQSAIDARPQQMTDIQKQVMTSWSIDICLFWHIGMSSEARSCICVELPCGNRRQKCNLLRMASEQFFFFFFCFP